MGVGGQGCAPSAGAQPCSSCAGGSESSGPASQDVPRDMPGAEPLGLRAGLLTFSLSFINCHVRGTLTKMLLTQDKWQRS